MTPKEKVENLKISKPKPLFYEALRLIFNIKSKIDRTKFYYHFDEKEYKNKQILLILDHSGRDSYMPGLCGYKSKRFNVVLGYHNVFVKYLFTPLLKAGVIPKKLFIKDLRATRNVLRAINMGCDIAIFIEGIQSTYGKNMAINPGTISLIKKAKLPVILCKSYGAYLKNPDYSKKNRKGKSEYHYEVLFSSDDVKKYSEDELYEILFSRFKYNDFLWNEKENNKYTSKYPITYKMTNLLYICPKCNSEFTLIEEGNDIVCSCCKNRVHVSDTYKISVDKDSVLPFNNISEWVEFEKKEAEKETENINFSLSYDATFYNMNYDKLQTSYRKKIGEGKVTLDKKGIAYIGTQNDENVELNFDIKDVVLFAATMGDCNDFMYKDDMIIFSPKEDKKKVIKYMFLEEAIYNKNDMAWAKVRNDVVK